MSYYDYFNGRIPDEIQDRDQDCLFERMPHQIYLDVGWYPDWDPNGEFLVRVFHHHWDKLIEPEFRTKDKHVVVEYCAKIAEKYKMVLMESTNV